MLRKPKTQKFHGDVVKNRILHILMIDDSEDDVLIIVRKLKTDGWDLVYERVDDAVSLRQALQKKSWDVVLCDYAMPRFSVSEAVAILREHPIEVPLMIVTGSFGDQIVAEGARLGARDFIEKGHLERLGPAIIRELETAELKAKCAWLNDELLKTIDTVQRTFHSILQMMMAAVEARDPFTVGHQLRAAELAFAIAAEMGLAQETMEAVKLAASVHDIGKLTTPLEVLAKPAKLTDIELSLVKEHPSRGFEILNRVESPWPLAQIVYQHHERINGSGYPKNLRGEEILLEARILAVSDVVESMMSKRSYRPALGIEAALEEIRKNRGILYDAAVADACLQLFEVRKYRFS